MVPFSEHDTHTASHGYLVGGWGKGAEPREGVCRSNPGAFLGLERPTAGGGKGHHNSRLHAMPTSGVPLRGCGEKNQCFLAVLSGLRCHHPLGPTATSSRSLCCPRPSPDPLSRTWLLSHKMSHRKASKGACSKKLPRGQPRTDPGHLGHRTQTHFGRTRYPSGLHSASHSNTEMSTLGHGENHALHATGAVHRGCKAQAV